MEKAIPEFLQYGALGVLALAFLAQLLLFVRSDRRAQKYAELLCEARFDRSQLIQVVVDNTKASTALAVQIAEQTKTNQRAATVIERLERRLDIQRWPLSQNALDGKDGGS